MNAEEILKKIDSLPSGGLTTKKIRDKSYTYYQWTENGKQRSRIVKEEEYDNLKNQIEERKELQAQLSNLEIYKNKNAATSLEETPSFITNVRIGKTLDDFSASIKDYKKRELYSAIEQYVYGDSHDKVFILYGLRRTGKTTLIRQIIYNMKDEEKNKSVFIQINPTNTLAEVNKDLRKLETLGYKYVFIDEVTMMDDFIQGAALFSDVFASSGMKIVLSGTDSLGFVFSEDEQLYDRCFLLHTTFIPFREFANVLGIYDIDQYMEFGGTMSQSGDNYNKAIFGTKKSTAEYVNTAIARNIQHSLKNYQYGSHFRNLKALYDKGELTNAINRIVEDMNHDFTIEVLTRTFKSHDFGSAKDIMRKDRENPTDILDDVDGEKITEKLKKLLRILNQKEQKIEIQEAHRREIKEYLDLLDLTCDIPLVNMNDLSSKKVTTVFSQPGLRYSQAESLIKSLMMDETFRNVDAQERKRITERIFDDIKGRMLEEIVQLETKKANPDLEVFKLQFAVGEFDMVVYDPENVCCKIYEVKHSKEKSPFQYRHLINEENCKQTEFRFGKILEKVVLYRGETCEEENGIHYKNVEEYLIEN
ncbi:AAA family ATPase [Treponema sp.]|uniref:AAA family ATPase n=1 Tax=Treponema sp. TaxID=166 RepID=UPI00257DB5CC|nr:AAA family ATPase [Treponema sp.]MBE6353225.1 ATP-binding protein [Treponema sp.]